MIRSLGDGVRARTTRDTSQRVIPDTIDELDDVTAYSYHHEGPYDAVCPERNRVSQHSPLEAVRESNEEALRATPRDKIVDCLNSHRPLDGTACLPLPVQPTETAIPTITRKELI